LAPVSGALLWLLSAAIANGRSERSRRPAPGHCLPLATVRFGAAKPPFELVSEVADALGPRAVVLVRVRARDAVKKLGRLRGSA
jgi:hypothetical protein